MHLISKEGKYWLSKWQSHKFRDEFSVTLLNVDMSFFKGNVPTLSLPTLLTRE